MSGEWKVPPRRWAELWFKMLGIITRHWSSKGCEETYSWTCPGCGAELKAVDRSSIIDKIEKHLLEDQKKGIIK